MNLVVCYLKLDVYNLQLKKAVAITYIKMDEAYFRLS